MTTAKNWNVSTLLAHQAEVQPDKTATIRFDDKSLTFRQLEGATRRLAIRFVAEGIEPGMKVATFVRPGLDFVPIIFALFRVGAVPVFIDPGMKVNNMAECVKESSCTAMVGVPEAFIFKKIRVSFFENVKINICLTHYSFVADWFDAIQLEPIDHKFSPECLDELQLLPCKESDLAAILFTSGSTGVPKGVEVTHGVMWGQQEILKNTFDIKNDEVDMVVFPLFALLCAAWGITSVIPDMDPSKPAKCSGKKLAQTILKYGVTHTAGSPAIWNNVLNYCQSKKIKLSSLKRVLMAGAPVSEKLVRGWREILEGDSHVFTPYGATEALPVSTIRDDELIESCYEKTNTGFGTCVGKPLENVKVKIVKPVDGPIEHLDDVDELPTGAIGEIIVQGPLVTKKYYRKPHANHLAKINDWDKSGPGFWHRMGDVGYFDQQGRLWFCGRKDHRVKISGERELYPVQLEPIFNQCPGVKRSALVGVPGEDSSSKPILMVEPEGFWKKPKKSNLQQIAKSHALTGAIEEFLFVSDFPTDVRHNIKINRPELSVKAQKELGR